MMITIAGCGAMGSLLAARLIEGAADVQAFQRAGVQLDALRDHGITVTGDERGRTRPFQLQAVSDTPADLRPTSLIVVLVKSYDTPRVSALAQILEPEGVVLTLQNGLGNAEILADAFGAQRVAAGTALYGAHRLAPGVVAWGGDGSIILGPWAPGRDMAWVADALRHAGLSVRYETDPRPALWKKLVVNAMVNPISALCRLKNGALLEDGGRTERMRQLGMEAVSAAGRAGVVLDFASVWASMRETLAKTADNRASMLQDVEAGRRTEIEAITGSILKYAQTPAEFPATRTVYLEVKNGSAAPARPWSFPLGFSDASVGPEAQPYL